MKLVYWRELVDRPQVAPPPIPLRPPAIPKRSKNEKPIPIQTSRARKASDPSSLPSTSIVSAPLHSWPNNEKLIDLGPLQAHDLRPDYASLSLAAGEEAREAGEGNEFVADFDKANFLSGEDCGKRIPGEKSSFEELQKASRDLEKRLHERIVASGESKLKDQTTGREERRRQVNAQNNR